MTELICRQIKCIAVMLAAGISIGIIFESLHFIAEKLKNKRVENLFYLFSWLLSAEVFSEFLYKCSYGKLSWYSLLSVVIGIILWKKFIYVIMFVGYKDEKTKEKRESISKEKKEIKIK